MKRSGLLLGCLAIGATWLHACSPAASAPGSDGGEADSSSPLDSSTPDTTAPDVSPPPPDSATDAARPPDSGDDDAGATDGATSTDASSDASRADGGDAAPTPTVGTTVVVDADDYDVNATHVLYRKGVAVSACELPACAVPRLVANPIGNLAAIGADDAKFYFFAMKTINQNMLHSRRIDFGARVNEDDITWQGAVIPQWFWMGAERLESNYRLNPFLTGPPQYQTRAHLVSTRRTPAIGGRHQNFGSIASLASPTAPTVTGATLPALATAATSIGTSPRGATVPHPTVVVLRDGNLEACTTAVDCPAWIPLGPLGTIFNLDETHLYVSGGTSLGRCALSEIAAAGTCTLAPLVSGEPVASPLLVTPTHVWYRSGTSVKNVAK